MVVSCLDALLAKTQNTPLVEEALGAVRVGAFERLELIQVHRVFNTQRES